MSDLLAELEWLAEDYASLSAVTENDRAVGRAEHLRFEQERKRAKQIFKNLRLLIDEAEGK